MPSLEAVVVPGGTDRSAAACARLAWRSCSAMAGAVSDIVCTPAARTARTIIAGTM